MTNTTAPATFDFSRPSCGTCGTTFSRRRDIARHVARKHPELVAPAVEAPAAPVEPEIVPTPLSEIVPGTTMVEWAGVRRLITDVRLTPGRKPVVRMGKTFKVTVPSTSFKFRRVVV
jgi:hypothetical protein